MPPVETKEPTLLERLHEQRGKMVAAWEQFIDAREKVELSFSERSASEDNKPSETEVTAHADARIAYRAEADQREAEIKEFDLRIKDQGEIERRRGEAGEAAKESLSVEIVSEPLTYERYKAQGEKGVSYYRDLAAALVPGASFQGTDQARSMTRLVRHAEEMDVEMPKLAKKREDSAKRQLAAAEGTRASLYDPFHRDERYTRVYNPFEQRVEPNSADGQGGFFIPPLWLVSDYIPGLRAHLIAAALCRQFDLPQGTDSINIPKLANLTTVGYQQMNNAGLPSTDWTDTAVTANVKTVGGYSDVAIQLLEQSPNGIVDEVVTTDLMAAYNTFLDLQVIAGDGLNTGSLNGGHLLGIYPSTNWASTNTVTYTDGSPQPWHFTPGVLGPMASKISRTRFDAENYRTVLHGRRWFWHTNGLDGNDRPIGETPAGGRFNIAAAIDSGLSAEGLVGSLPTVADTPVYIDDNIPTTDTTGGGSGQDIAIAALWDDCWLFKGDLRTNVYREILSGSLGVRFQVYNYCAFLVRYGQSLAVATGSGFAQPSTGYGDFY